MPDAAFYENCWAELLKASRAWQLHYDVQQLLTHICHTAHDLLLFEYSAAFVLENKGIEERARWPDGGITGHAAEKGADARIEIARSVIQSGRSLFLQKSTDGQAQTILCAPLTATREILGALYLSTSESDRKIAEKDQQFFGMFASQAAACLEHTLLYQSAIADPLTGLFCHRHFRQEVDQAVRRAARSEQSITLLLMDLDHFKALNDSCGHEAGNQCLLQVASILRANFRATDILARFGGDEFEILLLDAGAEEGRAAAEKVREKIGALALPQQKRVTATIGIATYPLNAVDAQSLFLRADSALYVAKEGGRNRVTLSEGKPGDAAGHDSGADERAVRLTGSDSSGGGGVGYGGEATPPQSARARPQGAVEMVDGHIVKRRLGVGSTGEVLLVMQPGLDREVALKRPLSSNTTFEQSQIFEREAKVTAGLNHPGIVPIFNIGRDQDSRRYYTMKPLDGRTLAEIIDARRKGDMDTLHVFTTGRLLEILQRVCETVAYAHTRGVLHLDLTPGNVVVGAFGEVTVIDWSTGSRDSFRASDSQGLKLVGSPAFVAPETLRGSRHASAKSDVFALGTLLYYLLTDELPFQRATTAESIDALLRGDFIPPDTLKPEGGIDPTLSTLCTVALAVDPAQRPGAAELAERLGLYLRGEMNWSVLRFGNGPGEVPLQESDWSVLVGDWRLEGDNWVSQKDDEASLVFKKPAQGSFRFCCEAWADFPRSELSIFGHMPLYDGSIKSERHYERGYFFQVGAEHNTVNKLARHANDVVVTPGLVIEPGRRYRLEIEYQDQDGMIHCAVNGKRVLSYRELFPFPGSLVGFYSFSSNTHFKPLEIHRQNWNLQIPALRAADRQLEYGHLESALEFYEEIASRVSGRMQGAEATLKAGVCLARLGRVEEAYAVWERTRGTPYEPFALAEKGAIQVEERTPGCVRRSVETFKELFRRFPQSQARHRIFNAGRQTALAAQCPDPLQDALTDMLDLNHIAAGSFSPPAQSQLTIAARALHLRLLLGRWSEALHEWQLMIEKCSDAQRSVPNFDASFVILALANGRPDLFPRQLIHEGWKGFIDWSTGLVLHHAIHWDLLEHWICLLDSEHSLQRLPLLLLTLAKKDAPRALAIFDRTTGSNADQADYDRSYRYGMAAAHSLQDELLDRYAHACQQYHPVLLTTPLAWRALQLRDFDAAAAQMEKEPALQHMMLGRMRILMQALLASLGVLKKTALETVRAECKQSLYGTPLDLAEMFLGERDPVPGPLWPAPLWRPEWRLLLGLWLEAKGRPAEAHAIVAPSRDPRYGWTHAQPGIELLLARTGSKTGR